MPGRNPPTFSAAYNAFIASMTMDLEKWREGIGFDLEALKRVTPSERDSLVKILIERLESEGDWREIEALGAIGTAEAKEAIRRAADDDESAETRLYAARQLARLDEAGNLEDAIIKALRETSLYGGFSQALDMAEEHPTPRIQETLLDLALNGDEEHRIHCAALALYLGGKAEEAFDWSHRPFFLRFGENDRSVQIQAYKELCARLGVTPRLPEDATPDSR